MLIRLRLRLLRADAGAALILALIVVAILAIGIGALLSFADTSIRATLAVRTQGKGAYGADGAVQAAINAIRKTTQGADPANGGSCTSQPLTVNGVALTVDCQGLPGSGAPDDGGRGTTPKAAVITLSTYPSGSGAGQEHAFEDNNPGSNVTINGGVSSAQDITVDNGATLQIPAGKASAVLGSNPGCNLVGSGTITPLSAQSCGVPGYAATDPNYAPPPLPATTNPPLPACNPTGLNTLSPGIYTDALTWTGLTGEPALTAFLTCSDPARGAIFWFQPGVYYFNFASATNDTSPILIGGAKKSVYVAGVQRGWTAASSVNAVQTLAQNSNSCDTTQPGAEFVFGGYTRLGMTDGTFEFCPWYDSNPAVAATTPRISFYGVKDSSVPGYSPQAGCSIAAGPCSGGTVAWFNPQSPGGVGDPTYLTFWGTLYAPKASVILNLPSQAAQPLFNRGLVSRMLVINRTAASGLASVSCGALGCGAGPGGPRSVLFTAHPTGSSTTLLTALVTFVDNFAVSPTRYGEQVTIKSWSVYR